MAYEQKHMYTEAIREFNKASELPGGSRALAMAGLGSAYGQSGKHREARQVLADLEKIGEKQYVPAVYMAAIYAAMGETDHSIAWTRKGYEERSEEMIYLRTEPWADSLRSDPRFQDLLKLVARGHQ
jgi:tetratricopeptide (TPR) repeat protein